MFFVLSKTVGLLSDPMVFGLFLLALAGLLRLIKKGPKLRRWLVRITVLELWILSTGVVSNLLLHPLEERWHRPRGLGKTPAIVMLSGLLEPSRFDASYDLTESSDRFVEALRLGVNHPEAQVILTGGSANLILNLQREADMLYRLAEGLNFPLDRLIVERNARNTRENAAETAKILAEKKITSPVVLVTSAFHMPRAMACFAKEQVEAIPWPVDYRRTDYRPGFAWLPSASGLERSTLAIREYLGLLSYWMAGYV